MRNYNVYYDLDSIATKIKRLKDSEAYNMEIEIRKQIKTTEGSISDRFVNRFNEEAMMGKSKDDFQWWRKELKAFDANYNENSDYFTAKMGKRLRNSFMALAYESSNFYIGQKSLVQRLYCDKILVILHPDRPYWYFRLALTYADMDDMNRAIYNLKKARKLGFPNIEWFKSAKAFDKFKGKRKFDKFLASLNH